MIRILFVTSLTLIVGIQAYYLECSDNNPSALEYYRNEDSAAWDLDSSIRAHLKTMRKWKDEAYRELLYAGINIESYYTESTMTTKWEKIKGVSYKQAAKCYDRVSRSIKETVSELVTNKQAEFDALAELYCKAQSMCYGPNIKRPSWREKLDAEGKEMLIKLYVDICNLSGHVAPTLWEILRIIEDVTYSFLGPAEICYEFIKNEPGIKEESKINVEKKYPEWLHY